MSADPLAVHAPGEADLNVYAYVHGAVLKNVDPLGLDETDNSSIDAVGMNADGSVQRADGTKVYVVPEVTVYGSSSVDAAGTEGASGADTDELHESDGYSPGLDAAGEAGTIASIAVGPAAAVAVAPLLMTGDSPAKDPADLESRRGQAVLASILGPAAEGALAAKGAFGRGAPKIAPGGAGSSPFATAPGEAHFWSGRTEGVGGAGAAARIAKSKGGVTLESVIEQRGIKMPEWNPNDPASVAAWEKASAEYARGASGTVRAVVGKDLRPGNIWETVEFDALKSNPKVQRIIKVDPKTLAETTIFERGAQ